MEAPVATWRLLLFSWNHLKPPVLKKKQTRWTSRKKMKVICQYLCPFRSKLVGKGNHSWISPKFGIVSKSIMLNSRVWSKLVYFGAFLQAVLLMSICEQRLRFQMFYFLKNHHKIIVKCRWRSQSTAISTMGSWWNPGGSSGGKAPRNFWPFYM